MHNEAMFVTLRLQGARRLGRQASSVFRDIYTRLMIKLVHRARAESGESHCCAVVPGTEITPPPVTFSSSRPSENLSPPCGIKVSPLPNAYTPGTWK